MTSRNLLIPSRYGPLQAISNRPRAAKALFVLAHGAGAGMNHHFLVALAEALAVRQIATLRYQFPYMTAGRAFPDRAPILEECVRAAVARARQLARGVPIVVGGKSMGGRMSSRAQASAPLSKVERLVFLGFPLYPSTRPEQASAKAKERSAHLAAVEVPMLFIQGSRDKLADLPRMRRLVRRLGTGVTLKVIREGDHGFEVRVRSGRTRSDVIGEIGDAIAGFCTTG